MFRSKEDVDRILELEAEVETLKREITRLKDTKEYEFKKDLDGSTFEFDFKAVNAFSIERIADNKPPHTVIGYVKGICQDGSIDVGQWLFYCSQKEHNRLAEKFVEYTKSQPKKVK
jgi:hypothetical protein